MSRILAIDYGARRCGLAVSDPLRIIASGLAGVATGKLMDFLETYLVKEDVGQFVVGEPVRPDGSATDATKGSHALVRRLKKRWPDIPLAQVDEYGTSREAVQSLVASGVRKKARRDKKLVDEVAATIILQRYMESVGL